MKIFIAKNNYSNNIKVEELEITKECDKIYKADWRRINKNLIGECDSYGDAYGLTKEQAINAFKDNLNKKIQDYEKRIQDIKQTLENEIIYK
jgi:hypothetical protein